MQLIGFNKNVRNVDFNVFVEKLQRERKQANREIKMERERKKKSSTINREIPVGSDHDHQGCQVDARTGNVFSSASRVRPWNYHSDITSWK